MFKIRKLYKNIFACWFYLLVIFTRVFMWWGLGEEMCRNESPKRNVLILTLGYQKILTSSKVGQIILICICPFKNRISFNFKTGVQFNTESIKKNADLHTVFCIKKRRGHQIYNIYRFYSQRTFTPCSISRSILSHLLVTNCVSFVELY